MEQEQTPIEEPKDQPQAEAPKRNMIGLDENMSLIPKDATEMKAIIKVIAEGKGFPERFKTAEERIAAFNLATSLMGKKWQLALNNIANIKGQLCVFGELPGAIAEQTGQVAEKQVFVVDKNYDRICLENKNLNAEVYAGICVIQRKGREKKEFFYTIDEAKNAGQYPPMKWDKVKQEKIVNNDSPWMNHTKIMLMRKAMNMAVKFEFPDAMLATPIAEYDFDVAPDLEKDVTPENSLARELNQEYGSDEHDRNTA